MELAIYQREKKKGKQLRHEGKIPAIIYSADGKNETIYVDNVAFQAILRKIPQGRLSTTVFTLKKDKKSFKAIVKDIQYHLTTYKLEHIDFQILSDKEPVNVFVPIECTGVAACAGVKLGGVLRYVIRSVKVRCLPKDIPEKFEIDVANLGMMDVKRLSDLDVPKSVRPLAKLSEVAVAVAKR